MVAPPPSGPASQEHFTTYAASAPRSLLSNALSFARIGAFPELRTTPIVIGESDPDGCAACQGPQLGYRNGTMYASYTAAAFAYTRALARRRGVALAGALTWAFEFEDQPYFAGFRVLATNGIDLPVLNAFRLMDRLAPQQVAATSSADPGVDAVNATTASAAARLDRHSRTGSLPTWPRGGRPAHGPAQAGSHATRAASPTRGDRPSAYSCLVITTR